MTIEPFIIDKENIPDDCYVVEGRYLQNVVRSAKIQFRVVYDISETPSHPKTVGVLIYKKDKSKMNRALAQREARAKRKADLKNL
jgi:hypothetical protein